jgi:hypothetical protein
MKPGVGYLLFAAALAGTIVMSSAASEVAAQDGFPSRSGVSGAAMR